jgi:hypothetical protein
MGTQYSNFVVNTGSAPVLVGSAVLAPPSLAAMGPKEALAVSQVDQVVGGVGAPNASAAVVADRLTFDPALVSMPYPGTPHQVPEVYGTVLGGYPKNGAVLLELSGTAAQTVNLTNTAANAPASTAGDTVFATAYVVRVKNLGTAAVAISPGATDPSPLPALGGTSPTYTLAAGSEALFHASAGDAISATACNITFTPAASTNVVVTICGA